ncbi:MAG: CAP domain-containing protein [Candidatus Nitrosopolaris sp.]
MNRTTNFFVLLIVISFIFPATAIRYAQVASATPAESMENNATSTGAVDEAPPANMTQNNANMTGESTENNTFSTGMPENATSASGSTASNNAGNEQQESSNVGNATTAGVPENATSPANITGKRCTSVETCGIPPEEPPAQAPNPGPRHSGSMENATSGMKSNNIANARQESNSTGNTTSTGVSNLPSLENELQNATSPSGSTENNSTGTTPVNNGTGNGQQESNNGTAGMGIRASSNNETAADFANNILAVHNSERAAVGVPTLVWSDKLAADAKTWADQMAATRDFHHDTEHLGKLGEGENLNGVIYETTTRLQDASTAKLQEGWVNEKKYYQQWATDSLPKTANWTGWTPGHYNQMVWNTTKEVGCATGFTPLPYGPSRPDAGGVYLVCRYSPPGNIVGQKPY